MIGSNHSLSRDRDDNQTCLRTIEVCSGARTTMNHEKHAKSTASAPSADAAPIRDERPGVTLDAHVVFLVNFLAPNHIAVCEELRRRCRRLTVLCSVAMEGNRDWTPDWKGLDVRVQKTWTLTRNVEHPGGYHDVNYVHIPTDTFSQLRGLRPDAVVSLELGARTAMAATYQRMTRRCAMVISVNASERSEAGRGVLRRVTRKRLLRTADWVTYNGPSCQRYLRSLGADPERMSPWDYAADPDKPFRGEIESRNTQRCENSLRVLTVGQLSQRKGVSGAIEHLSRWASDHSNIMLHWHLLGNGPMEASLRSFNHPENLRLHFHGHCDSDQIQNHYRDCDVLLFPTLTDEWGLVVDESLHSGLPVIGSIHSQAVTTLITESKNGFRYDPGDADSLSVAFESFARLDADQRLQMRHDARAGVTSRTPATSAAQLIHAIERSTSHRLGTAIPQSIRTNSIQEDRGQ